jgi:hypothetical protein
MLPPEILSQLSTVDAKNFGKTGLSLNSCRVTGIA